MEDVIAEFSEEFGEDIAETPDEEPDATPSPPNGSAVAALEKRLSGVEKAMNITVNLLRQLIKARQRSEGRWPEKHR
jgi:hypothetical protein